MSIYMSSAELEEISEGLITAYANKFSNRVIQSIDIVLTPAWSSIQEPQKGSRQ